MGRLVVLSRTEKEKFGIEFLVPSSKPRFSSNETYPTQRIKIPKTQPSTNLKIFLAVFFAIVFFRPPIFLRALSLFCLLLSSASWTWTFFGRMRQRIAMTIWCIRCIQYRWSHRRIQSLQFFHALSVFLFCSNSLLKANALLLLCRHIDGIWHILATLGFFFFLCCQYMSNSTYIVCT